MPSSTVRTFTDPDAYHAAIRDAHAEGIVTGRGVFRAELTKIGLTRISLQRGSETLPRGAYSEVDAKICGIVFLVSPDPPASANGVESSFGGIVIYRVGSMRYNRSSSACQWGSIALPNEDLAGVPRALVGRELIAPPVTHRIKPSPAALKRLLNLHEAAGHLAKAAPDILAKPEVGRAIDQAFAEAMLACLTAYSADERGAYRSHARVMQRLEEVLRANPEGSLYMDDLCKAIGVTYKPNHERYGHKPGSNCEDRFLTALLLIAFVHPSQTRPSWQLPSKLAFIF